MAVLSIYLAGVSTTGIELVTEAATQAFGECSVEELNRDNLRFKVRTGTKDASVVLIVLDDTSMTECKDIENGLYSSEKFYNYKNDNDLVAFLNSEFDLSLEAPNDKLEVSDNISSGSRIENDDRAEIIEMYQSQLDDRDNIIKTLNSTISELKSIIYGEGYTVNDKEAEELKSKNLALISQMSDINRQLEVVQDTVKDKDAEIDKLSSEVDRLADLVAKYESTIKNLNADLTQERSTSSQKSGVIRDKDKELEKLRARLSGIEGSIEKAKTLEVEVADYKTTIKDLQATIKGLESSISSKDNEIERLRNNVESEGRLGEQALQYRTLLDEAESDKVELQKRVYELESSYEVLAEKHDSLVDELNEYDTKFDSLSAKYTEVEGYLTQANMDKVALQEKIRVLTESEHISDDAEGFSSEIADLRRRYAELQNSTFNVIGTKSLPKSSVKVPIMNSLLQRLKNVRFQFSGSSESKKGTYKCIYNEFVGVQSEKFLIVDVTSETAIDYVFGIRKVVDGLPWFASGGGVQKYLSSTCLPHVKVLMPKLGYINDSYFLTIDWAKRLMELERSGYRVVVYCGDISNLVGRVLFENFSSLGNTAIYVHGNALGSRSVIANSSGLTGIRSAMVAYFDYDKNMSNFLSIMERKCTCKVISYIKDVSK